MLVRWTIIKIFNKPIKAYFFVFFTIFLTSLFYVKFYDLWLNKELIFSGNDFTYEIFITKLAKEGNFLGISTNVSWPDGFGVWSNPLFGIGPYYLSLLVGTGFSTLNVYQIYFLVFSFGIALNAVCGYWMVEKEFSNKIYPLTMGLMVGLSPFALTRIGHMPVAWHFFPVLFLGLVLRLSRNQISRMRIFVITLVGGIFSPLWWTVVVLFLAIVMFLIYALSWKKSWQKIQNWTVLILGIFGSFAPIMFLIYANRHYSGIGSRTPWQSDVFGGHFSDILVSSPLFNTVFNLREKLFDGISPEARLSSIGIILGLSVIFFIIFLSRSYEIENMYIPKEVKILGFILLLFFITGGLGNLQSAFFVLLEQTSPARAWFRLIILLGILGFYLIMKFIEKLNFEDTKLAVMSLAIIIISLLDLKYAERINFIPKSSLAEFGPTEFLDSRAIGCPVLQLPIDTYPLMQDFLGENGSKFGYPQMIPYTLSSNNQWSLVATPGNKFWGKYKSIPTDIDLNNIDLIKERGYCAIWFDKEFSTWQINRKAGLDFTQGLWPGLRVNLPEIDFENERYQIYLLNNN